MGNNRFKKSFADADDSFNQEYKDALARLKGLSSEQIGLIKPDTADEQIYFALIKVVEDASEKNVSQAELIEKIKSLGEVAVKIAKKIPQFSGLL